MQHGNTFVAELVPGYLSNDGIIFVPQPTRRRSSEASPQGFGAKIEWDRRDSKSARPESGHLVDNKKCGLVSTAPHNSLFYTAQNSENKLESDCGISICVFSFYFGFLGLLFSVCWLFITNLCRSISPSLEPLALFRMQMWVDLSQKNAR